MSLVQISAYHKVEAHDVLSVELQGSYVVVGMTGNKKVHIPPNWDETKLEALGRIRSMLKAAKS